MVLSDHHTGLIYAPQTRTVAELDKNITASYFDRAYSGSVSAERLLDREA